MSEPAKFEDFVQNKELWEGCLWLFPDDRLLAELAYATLVKPPLKMEEERKRWVKGLQR